MLAMRQVKRFNAREELKQTFNMGRKLKPCW
jgi:hypothetical protein